MTAIKRLIASVTAHDIGIVGGPGAESGGQLMGGRLRVGNEAMVFGSLLKILESLVAVARYPAAN